MVANIIPKPKVEAADIETQAMNRAFKPSPQVTARPQPSPSLQAPAQHRPALAPGPPGPKYLPGGNAPVKLTSTGRQAAEEVAQKQLGSASQQPALPRHKGDQSMNNSAAYREHMQRSHAKALAAYTAKQQAAAAAPAPTPAPPAAAAPKYVNIPTPSFETPEQQAMIQQQVADMAARTAAKVPTATPAATTAAPAATTSKSAAMTGTPAATYAPVSFTPTTSPSAAMAAANVAAAQTASQSAASQPTPAQVEEQAMTEAFTASPAMVQPETSTPATTATTQEAVSTAMNNLTTHINNLLQAAKTLPPGTADAKAVADQINALRASYERLASVY